MALTDHAAKALIAGLVGAGIGWAANALTLAGRVNAIEAGQARIEVMVMQLVAEKARAGAK